ncbi:MAG: prolyl-tRNA synthetase, partial [Candidatus Bathyarchaeota archaeon B63]
VFRDLGLSYYILKRPDFDKFPGAAYSIAFDAWNPDGRINQIGTVHNLGENFSRAFEIKYEDAEGRQRHVVQTCYGFGISRTLAAVISQHGDDHGLVLPPEIAPIQVVIVPIPYKGSETEVEKYAGKVYSRLDEAGMRVHLDMTDKTPGEKYYYWEMFGVPVRVEVGPRDVEAGQVTICERVNLKRRSVALDEAAEAVKETFERIERELIERSRSVLERMTVDAPDIESLGKAIKARRIGRACWCGGIDCAERIREESGGEIRGRRIDVEEKPERPCIVCGREAEMVVYVARAY